MIASLAAGLGAENTRAWLISAALAVVFKVFVADPLKVCVLTAFLQYAEDYVRKALEQGNAAMTDVQESVARASHQVGVHANRVSVQISNILPYRHRGERPSMGPSDANVNRTG